MKAVLILLLGILSAKSYSQTFSIIKNRYSNAENSGWALSIKVEYEKGLSKFYSASCYFGDVAKFSDSVRISLIEQLLDGIENDTLVCAKPVEALSYRYRGRYNRNPESTSYNLQIEALILINYIAFSSDAINYSPFPVLINKKTKKEFTTTGRELNAVIKDYQKWFKKIKRNGFDDYSFPLLNKNHEWYGSLYTKQKKFTKTPAWEKFYDCPVLIKQED